MTDRFYGFSYLNKRLEEFHPLFRIATHTIGYPARTKVTSKVPYSNVQYDFSSLYGDQVYGTRSIKYLMNIIDLDQFDQISFHRYLTNVENWLEGGTSRQPLYDDKLPGWYFMAEPKSGLTVTDLYEYGQAEMEFEAYPFMIRDKLADDDVWDTFDFDYDIAQTAHALKSTGVLFNNSATSVQSTIITDRDTSLKLNSTTYQLKKGSNTVYLPKGSIAYTISNEAVVNIEWRLEVL